LSKRQNNYLLESDILYRIVGVKLGKKIKLLRTERGLTQQDLADKINKTRALVSGIEVTSQASPYTLADIANVLGVPYEYLANENHSISIVKENSSNYSNLSDLSREAEKNSRENKLLLEIIESKNEIIKQLKEEVKRLSK